MKELGTSPAQPPQPQPCAWCCSPALRSLSHVPVHPLGGTAVSQGEKMLSTPGPGYPHHHSCLCPCPHACWLRCRGPRRAIGHPHCLSLARDKPGAEEFVGTPQLDYPFLLKRCLTLATPHQHHNHLCSFSFIQDCCHQKEKNRGKTKPGPISPPALRRSPSPMPRAGQRGATSEDACAKSPSGVPLALPSPAKPGASYL